MTSISAPPLELTHPFAIAEIRGFTFSIKADLWPSDAGMGLGEGEQQKLFETPEALAPTIQGDAMKRHIYVLTVLFALCSLCACSPFGEEVQPKTKAGAVDAKTPSAPPKALLPNDGLRELGETCLSHGDCRSKKCLNPGSGIFVCSRECDGTRSCGDGLSCIHGACVPSCSQDDDCKKYRAMPSCAPGGVCWTASVAH